MGEPEARDLGELLLEEGVVTREELDRFLGDLQLERTSLGRLLKQSGAITRQELAAFLGADYDLPTLADLRPVEIPASALDALPAPLARRHSVLPLACTSDLLVMAAPSDIPLQAVREIRRHSGRSLKIVRADAEQIAAALEIHYGGKKASLPPPEEQTGEGDVPLIGMADEEAPAPRRESRRETASRSPEEAPAVQVTAHEFDDEKSSSAGRLAGFFEQTHLAGEPLEPIRIG